LLLFAAYGAMSAQFFNFNNGGQVTQIHNVVGGAVINGVITGGSFVVGDGVALFSGLQPVRPGPLVQMGYTEGSRIDNFLTLKVKNGKENILMYSENGNCELTVIPGTAVTFGDYISKVTFAPGEYGDIKGDTNGGHLVIEGGTYPSVDFRTSGGHIDVRGKCPSVHARTSGGHVTADGDFAAMTLHTSGGHIRVRGHVAGPANFHTSGGNIDIEGTGKARASTSGGRIRCVGGFELQ
jgi:DUF4097 and DUF4098 domain-containing protein YvlB